MRHIEAGPLVTSSCKITKIENTVRLFGIETIALPGTVIRAMAPFIQTCAAMAEPVRYRT